MKHKSQLSQLYSKYTSKRTSLEKQLNIRDLSTISIILKQLYKTCNGGIEVYILTLFAFLMTFLNKKVTKDCLTIRE